MKNILVFIKQNGIKDVYSTELQRNIQLTNLFIVSFSLLVVPFAILFYSSIPAALTCLATIVVHSISFTLIRFYKHKAGRFLFSITAAGATYIIGILLYNVNITDGMGVKIIILGTIIIPFVVFRAKERIFTIMILIIMLILIYSFNYIDSIIDIKVTDKNFDTQQFRILSIFTAFSMIALNFFLYQTELARRNKQLEEQSCTIKEQNEELLASEEELKQQNEELITLNEHINKQKDKIEEAHSLITGSINYAKRIQQAMLPAKSIFEKNFSDFFILYKPRDIVSGDFYWAEQFDDKIIYAVADCTGHGVPGAMVSMLGISLLNKIVTQNVDLKPSEVLDKLRTELKKILKQTSGNRNERKDGMDIALCLIDLKTKEMQFSGAYNSLLIYRKNKLTELKANKQPIGIYPREKKFTNHEFQLQKDDILYSFSDGFSDQFNPAGEKYKIRFFKQFLVSNAENDLSKQKQNLENEYEEWKGKAPQLDDITILGLKI